MKRMRNDEKLMQFVAKVLAKGGKIELTVNGYHTTKDEAKALTAELAELLETQPRVVEKQGIEDDIKWFSIGTPFDQVQANIFYNSYLVEDAVLTGTDFEEGEISA